MISFNLSICKEFNEWTKGDISIEREDSSKGGRFVLSIPLAGNFLDELTSWKIREDYDSIVLTKTAKEAMFEYENTEDFKIRSSKLAYIRSIGMNPYPHKFFASHSLEDVVSQYEGQELGDSEKLQLEILPKFP